jgi:hypothetical protein
MAVCAGEARQVLRVSRQSVETGMAVLLESVPGPVQSGARTAAT